MIMCNGDVSKCCVVRSVSTGIRFVFFAGALRFPWRLLFGKFVDSLMKILDLLVELLLLAVHVFMLESVNRRVCCGFRWQWLRGLMGCCSHDLLVFGGGQVSEVVLPVASVVGAFNPGDDRDA